MSYVEVLGEHQSAPVAVRRLTITLDVESYPFILIYVLYEEIV